VAIGRKGGPVALALSRQKLPVLDRSVFPPAENVGRGAYVLSEAHGGDPRLILMASGSEVAVVLEAQRILESPPVPVPTRVVSFPSWELFEEQPRQYRDSVLPPALGARLAVEAAQGQGWERYVGPNGGTVGMNRFGASAPIEELMSRFGFTPENVVRRARELLDGGGLARR
jgi:transketolase